MNNFEINYNVPTETHQLARTTNRLAVAVGHGAIIAYAKMYDSIWQTDYTSELQAEFSA